MSYQSLVFIIGLLLLNPIVSRADASCDANSLQLYERVVPFYQSYSSETYMNLHCARNSKNFYELNKEFINQNFRDRWVIYIVNRDVSKVILPQSNRQGGFKRWTYHVVLLLDGLVVDMDYRKKGIEGVKHYRNMPALINFEDYLSEMWGDSKSEILFQIRPIDQITDLTEVEVDESIRSGEFTLLSSEEILEMSSSLLCTGMSEPYYQLGADKPF